MARSMHDVSDPRNASILINVNGELKPRAEAVVSVFDSGFMLGDGVWEGLRVHKGKLAFLDRHLDRLFEGAKAIAMDVGLTRADLTRRLYDTLDANRMSDGVHVRLMVTRGVRSTPYQDPRVVVTPATIVIVAEYKEPDPADYERGL
jgi:branched-chain amino acid aminotransferase